MKIIFSRKGFDSSFGGCPSPIDPSGNMTSLPIPGGRSPALYSRIQTPMGPMGDMVAQLSKNKIQAKHAAHLDPDLWSEALPRGKGWRASLGQTGAAQSHLASQNVCAGDVFLFFGWFRAAQQKQDKTWGFVPGSPHRHVLFGYLQVEESLHIGANPNVAEILQKRPWLHDHPHMMGERQANNTLHISSNELIINGRPTGLPGASAFTKFHPDLELTAPGCSKSIWAVPEWLAPSFGLSKLSYHQDPDRWFEQDKTTHLRSVAKGQEFVFDTKNHPPALEWVKHLAQTGTPSPQPKFSSRT